MKKSLDETMGQLLESMTSSMAAHDASMKPWQDAMTHLSNMEVREAAVIAAKACRPGLEESSVPTMVLNHISNIAVLNGVEGPEIEAMWSAAAEFGLHDLAYNAANAVAHRATTPSEYKLAARYYQRAIDNSDMASVKASALTNYGEIVREGYITGKKDWLGAIEMYERAASYGLFNGMFNAGNVLLWLVEAGDRSYATRAADWFEKIIEWYESGRESVDLGGEVERKSAYERAKVRLASMHDSNYLPINDYVKASSLLNSLDGNEDYVIQLRRNLARRVVSAVSMMPGKRPADNWISVLTANGWNILSEQPFDYGDFDGFYASGSRLEIDSEGAEPLLLLVFDAVSHHPSVDVHGIATQLTENLAREEGRPVFSVGRKAFFAEYGGHLFNVMFYSTVAISGIAPIWPLASPLEVIKALDEPFESRLTKERSDPYNSIPILVNALDEGFALDGSGLPNAIWVGFDPFRCPFLSGDGPSKAGIPVSQSVRELDEALRLNALGRGEGKTVQ